MSNLLNPRGPGIKLKQLVYYAGWENETLTTEEQAEFDNAGRPDLGYYQHTSLENIINNFFTLYVGEDRLFKRARRSDVAQLAQRSLEELSYDTSKTLSAVEVELNQANSIPFPQDAVKIRSIKFVDRYGYTRNLERENLVSVATPIVQEEDFDYQYKEDGGLIEGEKAAGVDRWQNQRGDALQDRARDLSIASNVDENFNIYELRRGTDRFGLNPERAHLNGMYLIDNRLGLIHFNSEFQPGDLMVVEYVSNGLGEAADLNRVLVHKQDEDAIEKSIKAGLADVFDHPKSQIFKKEMRGAIATAKIRNVDYSPEVWRRLFRNRVKWIKH